ncbi:hypothetical protein H7J92_04500 [Sporosarcina aquimarina]|nr:hypothetical protein [Sporosarcina aquimarina]
MKLVLQPDDYHHVATIHDWIGHHHVGYIADDATEFSSLEEDVVHLIWFSPDTSVVEQYNILTRQEMWIDEMFTEDDQLTRLISYQFNSRANMREEIIAIDSARYRI